MESKTRTWHKPQLTVLVRSRPEEAVLAACKGPSYTTNPGAACKRTGTDCALIAKS